MKRGRSPIPDQQESLEPRPFFVRVLWNRIQQVGGYMAGGIHEVRHDGSSIVNVHGARHHPGTGHVLSEVDRIGTALWPHHRLVGHRTDDHAIAVNRPHLDPATAAGKIQQLHWWAIDGNVIEEATIRTYAGYPAALLADALRVAVGGSREKRDGSHGTIHIHERVVGLVDIPVPGGDPASIVDIHPRCPDIGAEGGDLGQHTVLERHRARHRHRIGRHAHGHMVVVNRVQRAVAALRKATAVGHRATGIKPAASGTGASILAYEIERIIDAIGERVAILGPQLTTQLVDGLAVVVPRRSVTDLVIRLPAKLRALGDVRAGKRAAATHAVGRAGRVDRRNRVARRQHRCGSDEGAEHDGGGEDLRPAG